MALTADLSERVAEYAEYAANSANAAISEAAFSDWQLAFSSRQFVGNVVSVSIVSYALTPNPSPDR